MPAKYTGIDPFEECIVISLQENNADVNVLQCGKYNNVVVQSFQQEINVNKPTQTMIGFAKGSMI